MSWASKRTTTRPEDQAYSLLGLFSVNMPLLYGEGVPKAFRRLQMSIIAQSGDESIFVWGLQAPPRKVGWPVDGVLASSPADFAGTGSIRRCVKQRYSDFYISGRSIWYEDFAVVPLWLSSWPDFLTNRANDDVAVTLACEYLYDQRHGDNDGRVILMMQRLGGQLYRKSVHVRVPTWKDCVADHCAIFERKMAFSPSDLGGENHWDHIFHRNNALDPLLRAQLQVFKHALVIALTLLFSKWCFSSVTVLQIKL